MLVVRASVFALVGGLVAGCGGLLDAHRSFVARESAARIELRAQVIEGNLRILAPATVNGARVTMAIDTGAVDHLLTRSQARVRGVESRFASSVSIVPNGERVSEENSTPVMVALFPRERSAAHRAIVRDNPAFDSAGVAGFAAPLRTDDLRSIELDLPRMSLSLLGADVAERAHRELSRVGTQLEDWAGGTERPLRTVMATVDGHPSRMIVDTGSPSSFVYADTAAGADAATRTRAHVSIAWPPTDIALIDRAQLTIAGASFALRRFSVHPRVDDGLDGVDGVLGLDVLRGCAMLFAPSGGGAIACESTGEHRDTAPGFDALRPIAPAPSLAATPAPLEADVIARLGCESVSARDVEAWANERAVRAASAREAHVRARVIAHVLASWGVTRESVARPDRVEALFAQMRAEHGLLDQRSLDDALRAQGQTESSLRASLADRIVESFLLARVIALDPRLDRARPEAALDALVARMRDRLSRVAIERRERRCEEQWPAFWIEQLRWRGLDAQQRVTVQREVAKVLRGGRLVLDALGIVASSVRTAVARGCAACGREPSLIAHEEGSVAYITVSRARE